MSTRPAVIYRTMRADHLFVTDLLRSTRVTLLSFASTAKLRHPRQRRQISSQTFCQVKKAGNTCRSESLILEPAGFRGRGNSGCVISPFGIDKVESNLPAVQLLGSESSTLVRWRRFNETNRQIGPAGTLGIPLRRLGTVYV